MAWTVHFGFPQIDLVDNDKHWMKPGMCSLTAVVKAEFRQFYLCLFIWKEQG